jgi:opacity protein-like surface antigen
MGVVGALIRAVLVAFCREHIVCPGLLIASRLIVRSCLDRISTHRIAWRGRLHILPRQRSFPGCITRARVNQSRGPRAGIGAAIAGFSHTDVFFGGRLRKLLFAGVSLVALGLALEASAADLNVEAVKAPVPALVWNWAGLYIGTHVGGAWGMADFSDPFGTSVFGDKVRTPGFLGGGQVGYNWQSQGSNWLFGVEADISGFDSDGTNTCFASSALTINATCRVRPRLAGTFTGRIGYAVGASGHTLIYGKGGVAWVSDQIDMALNAGGAPGFSTSNSQTVTLWGGTFGVGVDKRTDELHIRGLRAVRSDAHPTAILKGAG